MIGPIRSMTAAERSVFVFWSSIVVVLRRIFHTEFGVSLAPRLWPGGMRSKSPANRFNGLLARAEAVETAWALQSSIFTGLKPGANESGRRGHEISGRT